MRGPWVLVGAVLLLVLPLGGASSPSQGTTSGPTDATTFNGNFSLSGIGPQTDVPAGSNLTVQLELRDPAFTSAEAGLYVHIPAAEGLFNVSYGLLHELVPGSTVQFVSTGWTDPANTTYSFLLTNETVFSNTGNAVRDRATVSTQGLAMTSAEPFGHLAVGFRWRWLLIPSAGSSVTGPWTPSDSGATITPGQYAQLGSVADSSLAPGQVFGLCLNGPVAGRTFQLQGVIPNPHLIVSSQNNPVPPGTAPPFCASWTVPAWLAPQTIQVYVWDLVPSGAANVTTFLLYIVKLQVVPIATPPPSFFGIDDSTWYLVGTAGAGAAGAVVILLAFGRRPRKGPDQG